MVDRSTPRLPVHPGLVIEADKRVWSGRFPLDIVTFRHRRFDGSTSAVRTWELWRRGRAAALVPYDPWSDSVVMIEQFRLPALAAGVEPLLVELPAGLCNEGEDPATTIQRELQEETGMCADRLERIGGFLLTPGGADELCELYAGRVRAPSADSDGVAGYAGEASENEDIRIRVWRADAAIEAAFAGHFPNVMTSLSLFWLARTRERLLRTWIDR